MFFFWVAVGVKCLDPEANEEVLGRAGETGAICDGTSAVVPGEGEIQNNQSTVNFVLYSLVAHNTIIMQLYLATQCNICFYYILKQWFSTFLAHDPPNNIGRDS